MIRRIELHNFATHPDTEIEFGNGKNIIIGQTGSGKTNLLQAIDFAFLGEVQGATLPELIADGAESTEVFLDYVDSRTSQTYRIHRTLSRDADDKVDHACSITNLETNEEIKRPAPVRTTLEALGVEQSVFRYVVHVPQGRFADVLQETVDRKAVLDRLFRISQLENAYHELGVREGPITQIEKRRQNKLLDKAKLKETASRLAQEQEQLRKLTQERQTKQQQVDETRKKHDELTAIAQPIEQRLTEITDLNTKHEKAEAMNDTCNIQVSKLLPQLRELLESAEYPRIETMDSQATRKYMSKLEADQPTLSTERDKLELEHTESIKKAATTKSKHDNAVEQRTSFQKQIDDINKCLEGKGERPIIECDKCGSMLTPDQWAKHVDETIKKLDLLETEINHLQGQFSSETQLSEEVHKKLEQAKTRFDNQGKAVGILEQLATQREDIEKATNSREQILEQEKSVILELRKLLSIGPVEPADKVVEQARLVHSQLESIPKQMRQMERDLDSYDENVLGPQQKRVDEAQGAVDKVKELDPEIRVDTKRIELLQTIRSAFREIQPAVRMNFVFRITASANDYLARLYGGSEIENFEFSEEYEFIVTRAGHKRHAHRLSGGQQVLASMAFLMALSEVLSQLDFLILDEPTTHLDPNRRKELVNVLENLRRVPQLIIVDYNPELLAAADTRFRVTLTDQGQSQVDPIEA
jgi:exonuclease SbcC